MVSPAEPPTTDSMFARTLSFSPVSPSSAMLS
jgi:hypothetical protein